MRKLSAALAMGVVALATACSGSSSPANTAGGPTSGSPNPTPSVSFSTKSTAPSASPGAKPSGTATPAAGHTVSSGPGSKPPGKATGYTRAGTYTYDVDGTATTRLGTQKLNSTDTLAVDPPKSGQQKSTQNSQQGHRDQTLAVRSSGLYIVDIQFHEPGFDEDFKPLGAGLFFPGDYHVGSTWNWSAKSTDGKYRLDDTSKITSTAKVTIGGQSVPTLVVDSTLHFRGNSLDLTDQQRDWVSTAYALIVKEHVATSGTAAGFKESSQETRTVRSTTPSSS